MPSKPPLSLRARALALLAQREQSPVELRRKLMRHAMRPPAAARDHTAARESAPRGSASRDSASRQSAFGDSATGASDAGEVDAAAAAAAVEDVLAWLLDNRYLSPERFVESRVNARASRFGQQRIRQELARHGLRLDEAAAVQLAASEVERAIAVHRRKYGELPATLAERACHARFLAARGFSAEAVRAALRGRGGDGIGADDASLPEEAPAE